MPASAGPGAFGVRIYFVSTDKRNYFAKVGAAE